jgi:hypothetical protein
MNALLRIRPNEWEAQLLAAAAEKWHNAAVKACYPLNPFANTTAAEHTAERRGGAAVLGMQPSLRNFFMKKLTRERVVPIFSASVS